MDTKERILVLLRYLQEHTDEDTAVSNSDLRQMFREIGESVSLPTLRDDIASLRRCGYDIDVNEQNGVGTYYKFLSRDWSLPELQILIDAVSAGQFLTVDKTDKMIQKLRQMAGPSERGELKPSILTDLRLKAPNEQILYIVQTIKDAMKNGYRISFIQDEYTPEMERVPKHGGCLYEVSPYAMIWERDRYYLVGWSEKHDAVANFRIDRMELPEVVRKEARPMPPDLHLEDYSGPIFKFFGGRKENVTLRFRPALMNSIVDRFGTGPEIRRTGEDTLETTVPVQLSPTFYAWLFQYAGSMTVSTPEYVREEYAQRLRAAIDDLPGN